jgi:hypothetical protein
VEESDLDPEIEALLAEVGGRYNVDNDFSDDDFADMLDDDKPSDAVDLSKKNFTLIGKLFEDAPDPIFNDPAYYKTALSGENETANRLHATLTKFITCQDPKDRGVFRQQVTTAYWEFLKGIAQKITSRSLPKPKKFLMRYAVVHPSLFTPEYKQLFATIIQENNTNEPVYYLDEWFADLTTGKLTLSATDEARPQRKSGPNANAEETQRIMQLQTKTAGKIQSVEGLLNAKEVQRVMLEDELHTRIDMLCVHENLPGSGGHKAALTEAQKKSATEITDRVRQLLRVDKDIAGYLREFQEVGEMSRTLELKLTNMPADIEVSKADILTEMSTVRQMAKMTIGRQGNHFPVFTKEYFHCLPRSTGTRENVINLLAWIESIDPGAFCRIQKNTPMRIVPYVLLIPTYGDTGICWEPFNRYNRLTSRGRIIIPMYSKDIQQAVISAVADLRWQVAKEKAAYYWMEEGLTGQFYQWFTEQKLKGDIKDAFVENYTLWLTKESDGVQRLDKALRGIFWRHVPFAQQIKDKLKTRSMAYQELFQRDINRSMSDGY